MSHLLQGLATTVSALNDLTVQVEVSNVLTSTIDVVVDAQNRTIVEDLTTELQLVLHEQKVTESQVHKLQEERKTYMKEALLLRDQLVHDYRNMLIQLDESKRQLAKQSFRTPSSTNASDSSSATSLSNPNNATTSQPPPPPPPPSYNVVRSLDMQPVTPIARPRPISPDLALRRLVLAPSKNPGRIVKKILSYFDAADIYVLCYSSKFYNHLINWIFEEIDNPPPLIDVESAMQQQQRYQQQQQQQQQVSTPPPPPPPYTPTQQMPNSVSSNQNTNTGKNASRMKKAEQLSRSMSRREMKEITKLGARCKLLEKKVMILTNEKDDLLSQTDAFANVKQFLIDKIKALENNVQRLQSQTDNDQQIINFLDDSIKVKEREQNEWMIERDAYKTEKLKWNETSHLADLKERELSKTIDQLKSQKKVLVNEVKRMRREKNG